MSLLPPSAIRDSVLRALPVLAGLGWQSLAGGRTNRAWRIGDCVVKVYDPDAASPLFPNDPRAEARALAQIGPVGLAPRLLASGDDWVAYAHVEGTAGEADPAAIARCLFRIHQQPGLGYRSLPSGSAALIAQTHAILAACNGHVPPPPHDPNVPAVPATVLVHGDAVPGNIIATPNGPVLIDWQCPARADPTEDLATFLSPAMHWLYRGKLPDEAERAQFLDAYPDPVVVDRYLRLAPLFRWRMAAHCLWKTEHGAVDYATALRLELG
jgi:thiamine kinase